MWPLYFGHTHLSSKRQSADGNLIYFFSNFGKQFAGSVPWITKHFINYNYANAANQFGWDDLATLVTTYCLLSFLSVTLCAMHKTLWTNAEPFRFRLVSFICLSAADRLKMSVSVSCLWCGVECWVCKLFRAKKSKKIYNPSIIVDYLLMSGFFF